MNVRSLVIFLALCSIAFSQAHSPSVTSAPLIDYHQHLFSPETAKLAPKLEPLSARSGLSSGRRRNPEGIGVIGRLSIQQPKQAAG